MKKLTDSQADQAWELLMTLHYNTDKDIANILGLPVEPVRVALTKLQGKKMARINKEVNKRYEERKLSERFRAEQQRKVLVQNREGNKNLDGPRHKPGKGRTNGMDN